MLFCDIAPPAERAHEFLPRVPVVLDHHKGAEHLVKTFTHHVFADEKLEPGVSGAVLAYREVWKPLKPLGFTTAADFARLAGVCDTWQASCAKKHFQPRIRRLDRTERAMDKILAEIVEANMARLGTCRGDHGV